MAGLDPMLDPEEFAQTMREIERGRMPFGKYGPDHFPPLGTPLYDLPLEYLQWFSEKGFPNGRIGELLAIIYPIKAEQHVTINFRLTSAFVINIVAAIHNACQIIVFRIANDLPDSASVVVLEPPTNRVDH